MKQYIDKSIVIKKIEDWRDDIKKSISAIPLTGSDRTYATSKYVILGGVMDFISSFEVKEVDLEKEYKKFIDCDNGRSMFETARHFFELGLKVQKGEDF